MDRILLKITLLLLAGTGGIRCVSQDNSQIYRNYNTEIAPFPFFAPDNSIELHKDLNEISGLSYVEEGILAAVEDEHGRIYLLDSENGRILKTYKFEGRGDFEAIEYDDGIYYAMESNGDLFSVTLRDGETEAVEKYDTGLKKANDVEGLGIFEDKLIAACKGDGEIDGNDREGKTAYLLDDEFLK
ncbi:MAG: SdiA-regulated domain-containing protein [Cyclobacteriaceae bacterium]